MGNGKIYKIQFWSFPWSQINEMMHFGLRKCQLSDSGEKIWLHHHEYKVIFEIKRFA